MGSKSTFLKCKSCGKDISTSVSTCPHCGVKLKKLKTIYWIGIVLGMLILIGIINSPDNTNEKKANSNSGSETSVAVKNATAEINKPEKQKQFEEVITKHIETYKRARNELQKSSLRSTRRSKIGSVLNGLEVQNWSGIINKLSTNSEGRAILSVRINPNIEIKTWNNAVSDIASNTLIEQNTQLYNQLMELDVGQQVVISGYFFNSDEDFIEETSLTEKGSMVNPEFLLKFVSVTSTK